jgi:hypothetical protein
MTRQLGTTKLQMDALNRHLACSRFSWSGLALSGIISGLCESFQGKLIAATATPTTFIVGPVNGAADPYYVYNSNQILAIYTSAAGAVTGTGIIDPTAATHRGRLVLGAAAVSEGMAVIQDNALWITSDASFECAWDIAGLTGSSQASGVTYAELGVMGSQATKANIADPAKEPGDGNVFLAIQIASGKGKIRLRKTTSGTITESDVFEVPSSGSFGLRMEYGYNANGVDANTVVHLNNKRVASLNGVITGPLQCFVRTCNGAAWTTGFTASVLQLDAIMAAVPLAFGE